MGNLNGETLVEVLIKLFPKGTIVPSKALKKSISAHPNSEKFVVKAPVIPTDLFGAMAYLLKKSGAYHRIFPLNPSSSKLAEKYAEKITSFASLGTEWNQLTIDIANSNGADKRKRFGEVENEIQNQWTQLLKHSSECVFSNTKKEREWWFLAASLLIFADEACRGLGYQTELDRIGVIDSFFDDDNTKDEVIKGKRRGVDHVHLLTGGVNSYAPLLNKELSRVLPKGRTPDVGCTFRSLTHNLSFIEGSGLNVSWFSDEGISNKKYDPINVLLVPFPFEVSAKSFQKVGDPRSLQNNKNKWGW